MLETLNGDTRLYPIIGDPIRFVQSPNALTRGFQRRGHNGICLPMQVPAPDLDAALRGLTATANVDGLLVTMPHKSKAFGYCKSASDAARRLGCVSVMRRNADRTWHGDMLDGLAFVKAQINAGARVKGAKALLVGSGAAGSAIALALLEEGVRELVVHDTDASRIDHLIRVAGRVADGRVLAGPADPAGCDLVCNATPLGLADGDPLPVPSGSLHSSMFVGDVIAGHGVTPLLRAALSAGCKTANGVQMVNAVQEMMLDFMLQ